MFHICCCKVSVGSHWCVQDGGNAKEFLGNPPSFFHSRCSVCWFVWEQNQPLSMKLPPSCFTVGPAFLSFTGSLFLNIPLIIAAKQLICCQNFHQKAASSSRTKRCGLGNRSLCHTRRSSHSHCDSVTVVFQQLLIHGRLVPWGLLGSS